MYQIEVNQSSGKKVNKEWIKKIIKFALKKVDIKSAEISIAIVGDAEMKRLNKRWRGKNRVTDVLSFDYRLQIPDSKFQVYGEIIICYPQAVRQARECGHGVHEEIKTLLVHGILHLCGYDHEKSARQAKEMEKMQKRIMNYVS